MVKRFFILIIFLNFFSSKSQNINIDQAKIQEDFDQMINDIKNNYIFLEDKNVSLDCIYKAYKDKIQKIDSEEDRLLFFEYLLDEFYDSHMILMKAIWPSYRLDSPIFTETNGDVTTITNVWITQLEELEENILGAEVLKINGTDIKVKIEEFPTECSDKEDHETRNWIANKVISGKYSEPRILSLKLSSGKIIELDLDKLVPKKEIDLLSSRVINNVAIIRLNNSLGNNRLIEEFDKTLNSLINTKGLILDLRNTTGGGNSYVARGLMSRFISEALPYQLHQSFDESWDNQALVARSWSEYVSPRGKQYQKPVVILVGKWTGSMGEGLAIGFDALGRAEIVGTEMKRLAGGSTNDFHLDNENINYKIMTEKLFHINGTPREKYVPNNYIKQTKVDQDEALQKAIQLIQDKMN